VKARCGAYRLLDVIEAEDVHPIRASLGMLSAKGHAA